MDFSIRCALNLVSPDTTMLRSRVIDAIAERRRNIAVIDGNRGDRNAVAAEDGTFDDVVGDQRTLRRR